MTAATDMKGRSEGLLYSSKLRGNLVVSLKPGSQCPTEVGAGAAHMVPLEQQVLRLIPS